MFLDNKNVIRKIGLIVVLGLILALVYAFYPSSQGNREFAGFSVATLSKDFINVHLVSTENGHFLVDTGISEFTDEIESFLAEHNVQPDQLNAIVVTHAHHDHAGSASYFQQEYDIKIVAGRADLNEFRSGVNGKLCPTSLMAELRLEVDQAGRFPAFTPDILVDDTVDLAPLVGISAKIYNLPGHTDGSVAVVMDDVAFLGDVVRGGILHKSSAAMHFYQCDLPRVKQSIERILLQLAPTVTTFFPSHMGPVTRSSLEGMLNEF